MTPVAIREDMNCDQPMMISRGDFFRRVRVVLDLRAYLLQQLPQADPYFVGWAADVLIRGAGLSCPPPGAVKHATVYGEQEFLVQRITLVARERPDRGLQDVRFLEFIEVPLQSNARWDQTQRLIGIQRRGTGRIVNLYCHSLDRRPSSNFRRRSSICRVRWSLPVLCPSSAMECRTRSTSWRARSSARSSTICCKFLLGTRAYCTSQPRAAA